MTYKSLSNIVLRLLAIALIQSFVLGWMVWDRVSLLKNGQEIRLSVVPVDPRDLLRGDYVILSFGISRIDTAKIKTDRKFRKGDLIYVGLKKSEEGQWVAISANHQLPQVKSEIVFIKGRITSASRQLRIKYGMEKYFIPEGEGQKLEALRNDKVLSIVAAVSNTGEAGIKSLLVRGKPVYEEPFF